MLSSLPVCSANVNLSDFRILSPVLIEFVSVQYPRINVIYTAQLTALLAGLILSTSADHGHLHAARKAKLVTDAAHSSVLATKATASVPTSSAQALSATDSVASVSAPGSCQSVAATDKFTHHAVHTSKEANFQTVSRLPITQPDTTVLRLWPDKACKRWCSFLILPRARMLGLQAARYPFSSPISPQMVLGQRLTGATLPPKAHRPMPHLKHTSTVWAGFPERRPGT